MIKRLYFMCLGIALGHSIACAYTVRTSGIGDESELVVDEGE